MSDFPRHCRAVIIGGGIVGCSTAYHLALLGWETVLLERSRLTSGSTFHAAGLVGQLRSNANITQLLAYSVDLYRRLEAETGLATGWKMNGGLRLACNEQRWTEVRRQATMARSFGLEMQLLTPREATELWPIMDPADLVGAAFLPTDGQANPSDITQSLARGARQAGALLFEDTEVTGIDTTGGKVSAVQTSRGQIACEVVVNCAGQWARQLGAMAGVNVPLVSVQHQYMVTEAVPGVVAGLPTLRDPDRLIYFKEDVGGLVMGGYEPNPKPWAVDGIPDGFSFSLLESDWDHFEPLMEQALERVPALADVGIKELVNGPESFTPDGNFILGEAPELGNFYIGAGFNAFGIAAGGGAGMALAEWIAKGAPPFDLWPVDIRRFGSPHRDVNWVRTRTLEAYTHHYTMAWPHEEMVSGRPCRRSPLYTHLQARRACFGEKLGWERPNWFAREGEEPRDIYSFGRQNWFEAVGEEHRAARQQVAVFDQSSFSKYLLVGRHAGSLLERICANEVVGPVGSLTYTQMLNPQGGIECDLTVARLARDRYYLVTGTGFATHDADWIRRNTDDDQDAQLVDITSAYAVLSVMGPEARKVLQALSSDDLSNPAFPFGTLREIGVAGAPVRALRVTYVGELGWELHIPVEYAVNVYQALMEAGQASAIRDAGYRAIESLRLEKGYRAWGADIGPDHTPFEAGLGWAVKLAGGRSFIGREAMEHQRGAVLNKRLACFTVDDPEVVLLGRETLYRDGERVGWLTSGGYGYTVGKSIGYGYVRHEAGVDREYLCSAHYQLEVATETVPCTLQMEPLYDPKMQRIKV